MTGKEPDRGHGPSVEDLEARAAAVLPAAVMRYFQQGAGRGHAAAEAALSWDRLRLLPHVLCDVTRVETATTILGAPVSSPVAIAPTTLQRAAHVDGEVAMARAAEAAGSLMVVSSNAGSRFADIGETGVSWWLQMYVTADRQQSRPLLEAAVDAGALAVCLTADTPVVGTKRDGSRETVWDLAGPEWVRANFSEPSLEAPGHAKATDLGPSDVAWLRQVTGLPVVVKGVLRADDARRCVEAGAEAVWVSNHGGRQLDRAVATSDCLGPVAEELAGTGAEVYVDGGIRCGEHVLAALALGARAAFLGRPALYALAAAGESGVVSLLRDLRAELAEALMLVGWAGHGPVPSDVVVWPGRGAAG